MISSLGILWGILTWVMTLITGPVVVADSFLENHPNWTSHVIDDAAVIGLTKERLESRLSRLQCDTGIRTTLITVNGVDSETVDSFITTVNAEWGGSPTHETELLIVIGTENDVIQYLTTQELKDRLGADWMQKQLIDRWETALEDRQFNSVATGIILALASRLSGNKGTECGAGQPSPTAKNR